ncbi:hypothetical protein [Jiangella anatolica]|nr:hypothetical protein [Jiangella anatolica]
MKIFGAVAALIIALFIVLAVAGGGDHGPGRHGGDHESSEGIHG